VVSNRTCDLVTRLEFYVVSIGIQSCFPCELTIQHEIPLAHRLRQFTCDRDQGHVFNGWAGAPLD
jgi:hypothetical protein